MTSIYPESDRLWPRGYDCDVFNRSRSEMLHVEDWKMLSLSGPKALLFLQLLIAFITTNFLLVSLVTTLVSLEGVCLPSFEVLNCWLNLVASCLDDENEIPLKVIASFSASRFALPSIPLIVLHSLVRSVFSSNDSRLHVVEYLSSGKLESTHPSRTVVKSIEVFYGVESVVRGNADSFLN